MDCLELAARARALDMRASPYDLAGFGFEPIAVENAAGRTEYVRCQQRHRRSRGSAAGGIAEPVRRAAGGGQRRD